jgi:hypothetical protein
MPRFRVPRMQTNTAWCSPPITFRAGTSPRNVDVRAWVLSGVACSQACSLALNGENGRLAITDAGELTIVLSEADCAALGPGRVDVEVLRIEPAPTRPLFRLAITNHDGLR